MPRPTPAERVMPIDWSTRPSSSIAMHRLVNAPPSECLERPAELLGHDEAEQAEVAHRRHEVGGEVVLAVPLGDVRLDRVGRELADHLAEVLVVLAQLVHGRSFAQAVPSPGRGARQSVGFLTLTST